jgi:hypothetical protein
MVPVVAVVVMDLETLVLVVLAVVDLVQIQQQDGQVLDHLHTGVMLQPVVEVDIMEPVVAVVVDPITVMIMVLVAMEEMVSSVLDISIFIIHRHSINCPQPLQEIYFIK